MVLTSGNKPEVLMLLDDISYRRDAMRILSLASLPLIVMSTMIAVSKYHITLKSSGINICKHPLVIAAKKLRPPIPRYGGNYDMRIILQLLKI